MISHDESALLRRFKCVDCGKAFKFKHHLKVIKFKKGLCKCVERKFKSCKTILIISLLNFFRRNMFVYTQAINPLDANIVGKGFLTLARTHPT